MFGSVQIKDQGQREWVQIDNRQMLTFQEKLRKAQGLDTQSANPKKGYKQIIGQLSQRSQAFEPGDLNRANLPNNNLNSKRRRTSQIVEEDDSDAYYEKPLIQAKSNRPPSLIGSKVNDNYINNSKVNENFNPSLLESKIYETKEELSELVQEFQRRMTTRTQKYFDYMEKRIAKFETYQKESLGEVVSQVNSRLNTLNKKNKVLESKITDEQESAQSLHKKFNDFMQETEQKMQKLMNSGSSDPNASIKRSMSRNNDANYLMELKSSIKDIPMMSSHSPLVDQLKLEISEIHDAIRSLSFDVEEVRKELKNGEGKRNPPEKTTNMMDIVGSSEENSPKLQQIKQDIRRLDKQLQDFCTCYNGQKNEVERILGIQEQNIVGMNEMFNKVVNTNIMPRLKKAQDQVHSLPETLETRMEALKKNMVRELESMPILRVRKVEEGEKVRGVEGREREVYLLDEQNYVLDCFGKYLVDEANRRVQMEEEQIYYLQEVEGIQFRHQPLNQQISA